MSSRTDTTTRSRRARDPQRRHGVLGVAAVLLVLVVGYVAYTANSGLPWEGRERYTLEVPNAERLIDAADVRIGGLRVGQVLRTDAERGADGRSFARVEIALDPEVGGIPVDSTARVRPASVLGLTYVDIVLGRSNRDLPEDGTLPLARATPAANLTDLFDVFEERSAARFREGLGELAGGLAGRGVALNATMRSLSGLLPPLTRVAGTLAATPTRLPEFIRAADTASAALAPVADELAGLVAGGATTFGAMAREQRALGESIGLAPSTETEVTRAFVAARPALDGLARISADLEPAARRIPATLRELNPALAAGVPALRDLPRLERPLRTALRALDVLSRDRSTDGALRKLADLASSGRTAISAIVPAQVHCNTMSLFTQGFAGTFGTQGTDSGPALATLVLSTIGGNGEAAQNAGPSSNIGMNPIPRMDAQECESGNEPWSGKQQLGNTPGRQAGYGRPSVPPPGVAELARRAGLLTDPEGTK